jgi:thermitase
MKKKIYVLIIALLSSIVIFGQNPETDQVIIKLKNDVGISSKAVSDDKIDMINEKHQAIQIKRQSLGRKSNQYIYIIRFPGGADIQQIIDDYYQTGEIEYAEPDHRGSGGGAAGVIPDDQYYYRQWALNNDGTFPLSPAIAGADIDMENAWSIEQGDSEIVVAVIDSGVKLGHPEFSERIWKNLNEIPNNAIDDDDNGYIDDVAGWNFAYSNNDPTDDLGHGTNITGIIGANANNSIGYAGVDWNCKLMILKALDNTNFGYYSWWSEAIYYAVDNGAKVINMSMGGVGTSITLRNAVNYALSNDVVVVACMMNTNSSTTYYPAGFPGVIAVGSTNPDDTRSDPFFWSSSSGSNYGDHISVVAPGNYIYGLNFESNTNYNFYWGGTSQATAFVSGLASLLLAQNPNITPQQIKSVIESTAEDQVGNPAEDVPGWDQFYGHGRINAFNALSFLPANLKPMENETVKVFPNPTIQYFTITFPVETRQIQILNSLGQLITTQNVSGQTAQDFKLTEQGMYYIQISSDKQTTSKRIIVIK